MAQSITAPRFFDRDDLLGHTQWFHFHPDDESFTIETVQDTEPILEFNKALYNDAPIRWGEFSHVAQIPSVIVMQLTKEGIMAGPGKIVDEPRFRAWLNERDNQAFRTRPGKI